jgi:hypothetical protein
MLMPATKTITSPRAKSMTIPACLRTSKPVKTEPITVYNEAINSGFDPNVLRLLVREKKMSSALRSFLNRDMDC